jgi:peptide/nickel transport system ATP-binding protein
VFALPALRTVEHTTIARKDREVVIDVKELVRQYPVRKGAVLSRRVGTVYAVDGVSFDVRTGEALALVGESGCGKTSTVTEILELRKLKGGSVTIFGKDAAELTKDEKQEVRRNLQVVFQDPQASLDPRLPVGDILAEPLKTHGIPKGEQRTRVLELLSLVGLEATHADRYPSEFSGGQRQRIAIARALALNPQLIILDEPVSALDVSIQAGVLNLLTELRARLGLAYIFVAHDLSVVRQTADRVAVMYLGRIIEIGDTDDVFNRPWHPYTQALLSAVPIPDPVRERERHRILLTGDQPSPTVHYEGCRFRSRCFRYQALPEDQTQDCRTLDPSLTDPTGTTLGYEGTHGAACFHIEERDVV